MRPGFYATYELHSTNKKGKVIKQEGFTLYGNSPGDLLNNITKMRALLKRQDDTRAMKNIQYFEVHRTTRYALAYASGYIKKGERYTPKPASTVKRINPMKYSNKAFTLIELLVVITIIAILAAIGGSLINKFNSNQDQFQQDPVYFPDQPQPQAVDEQKRANDLKEQELQFLKQKWEAEQKEKVKP